MNGAPAIIHATSFWEEPSNAVKTAKTPKRPTRKTAADYIDDLVGLGKAITLCQNKCLRKFNVAGAGYEVYLETTGYNHCISRCQGCQDDGVKCNTFLKTSEI